MSRSPFALSLLLVWTALLAAAGWYVQRTLTIGADLRLFLPDAQTPQQRLLLEEIGEGPASRMLVAAIEGAAPEELADMSRALVAQLDDDERFRLVANGEVSLESVPESLLPYRYLLADTLDRRALDAGYLRQQLLARARDLSSPAGAFLEPWLPRDPTLELLNVLQSWQPAAEPNRLYDVWFDRDGERALLLIETSAAAFDPDLQRMAIDAIHEAFLEIRSDARATLTVSGPGAFSVLMESRTRSEAQALGAAATVGMVLLLLLAYRRIGSVVLSALPLLSAGVAGLFIVAVVFGTVHGITLAFGFTLLGVAQDYPVHLMSHQREGRSPVEIVRELWPTLATGIASTCIAYGTFFFSGVTGLAQLASFTVTGLAVAGLATRFLLPRLIEPAGGDYARSRFIDNVWQRLDGRRSQRPSASLHKSPLVIRFVLAGLIVVSGVIIAAAPGPFWENDLGKLTPVPEELLQQDQELRSHLGTADIRYLLAVQATDPDAALARLETLDPQLQALTRRSAIGGYDHAARYVPSRARQLERQRKLPDAKVLRTALLQALPGTPFRADAFNAFVEDVSQARDLPPLALDALAESPLASSLESLILQHDGESTALITVTGVHQPQALQQLADDNRDVLLLDLKIASESLVASQRAHLLRMLAVAALLLVAVVAFALRDLQRVQRVLTPMALTTLIVVAVLHGAGVSLNLFHLVALILAAGLGLDYALFFEHAGSDPLEQRRTLHAVMICAASTLLVFALLATSSLPVLRAIGLTVTLGVASNFLLAFALTRQRAAGHWALGTGQSKNGPTQPLPVSDRTHVSDASSCQSPAPSTQQPAFASLLPHQGSMCLLERIIEWNDEHIALETGTHRSPTNPLRMNGRLRAIHLCEYGAQAIAVHGGLRSHAAAERAAPGMLVSLRSVNFGCDYIEDLTGALRVEARCLQASASSLQYEFRVLHEGALLAEGRAAVVLGKEADRG